MEEFSVGDLCLADRPSTEPPAACSTSIVEQGSGRWPDAFTIALGQEITDKWYVSTLELQLASFQICVACRSLRTLRVTVDKRMPLSLWGDEYPVDCSHQTPEWRQVPAIRAAGVRWVMPASMFVPLLLEAVLLRDVEWMQLTGVDFDHLRPGSDALSRWELLSQSGTGSVHSPRSYFEAMLPVMEGWTPAVPAMLNTGRVSWPPALRQLSIGCRMGELVGWVALPSSLERLALGGCFSESIDFVSWPVALKHLTLAGWFDLPIDHVVWPATLLHLTFGDDFDQLINDVVWPASLRRLVFGNGFDSPITDVVWPASLNRLEFGNSFNKPIVEVLWPINLQSLAFGKAFDQFVEAVVWPASLRSLAFGDRFVKPEKAIGWRHSLGVLLFKHGFCVQGDEPDFPQQKYSFDKPDVKQVGCVLELAHMDEVDVLPTKRLPQEKCWRPLRNR